MSFAEKVLHFYNTLRIDHPLPEGIGVMNPYREPGCFDACQRFYNKYYNDNNRRYLILGINPGRYGAGLTGIPFTDPIKLETIFGIRNNFPRKPELSAEFIHKMIDVFGGHERFFAGFFINSVSPLGFVKDGKNVNYYDSPALKKSLEPFIIASIEKVRTFGIHNEVAFCLGEGENYKQLTRLNAREKWFQEIIPLAHPRFIMQYKRKQLDRYIDDYVRKFNNVVS